MVPREEEVTIIDKNPGEITKIVSYRLQFTDSARFMTSLLSSRIYNLSEGIHKIKCTNCSNSSL